jgi:DNA processing protein
LPIGSEDVLWLRLNAIPGLGPKRIQALLIHLSPAELFALPVRELQRMGFNPPQCHAISKPTSQVNKALEWLDNTNNHLLHWASVDYPDSLRQIDAPPVVLFVEGDPMRLNDTQVAIIGSRHATPGGLKSAYRLASELAREGVVVTSGLAIGIDGAAHAGALEAGSTIAVVATGLDRVYPKRHEQLAVKIRAHGAMVSEFWPGTPPKAEFFPRRNRIISGLSRGVLVVEAAIKSGSLITARYAADQGREVFALPGSIDNPLCEGTHRLIQEGAKLITCTADILDEILPYLSQNLAVSDADSKINTQQQLPLGGLLDNVGYEATGIDEVVESSSLPVEEVVRQLTELEILGVIAAVPGGYVRLRRHP